MVAEIQDEQSKACADRYGTGADNQPFVDCMSKIPGNCEIVQNVDLKHSAHTCKRSCNKNAICRCHDGPACTGPTLPHEPAPWEGDDQ